MKKKWISLAAALILLVGCLPEGVGEYLENYEYDYAVPEEFRFVDTRFRGVYTTENLDAILEAYDLNDGWYWVTKADIAQNYHGHENKKGWTQSSQFQAEAKGEDYFYNRGWYGCRWEWNEINGGMPNAFGWGECFGFCQFLGYLLSGEVNPHGKWQMFNSVWEAGGLRVGDIIRVEYSDEKGFHQHSAMVYSVKENRVRFIQCSGTAYNQMFINWGFRGANLGNTTLISDISKFPGLRIHRAYDQIDFWGDDQWTEDAAPIPLNLVDLDEGMVAFLDPNDMRAWDVYGNWSQWSRRATEVDLDDLIANEPGQEPEETAAPQAPDPEASAAPVIFPEPAATPDSSQIVPIAASPPPSPTEPPALQTQPPETAAPAPLPSPIPTQAPAQKPVNERHYKIIFIYM